MASKAADKAKAERDFLEKYNIVFRGPSHPPPSHHSRSFQRIAELGARRFFTYGINEQDQSSRSNLWKLEIKARAKSLVEAASRLVHNQPSEMKWRLDIETQVCKGFDLNIEWYVRASPAYTILTGLDQSRIKLQAPLVEIRN